MQLFVLMRPICWVAGLCVASCAVLHAQNTEEVLPTDSPYTRSLAADSKPLVYDHLREADVFFEKRIWRIIDVREKINQPFSYPKAPFISLLIDAARQKELALYSPLQHDSLKTRLSATDLENIISRSDTFYVTDPVTFQDSLHIAHNDINPEDIKRFRIKEAWIFDKESSMLQCRILAIAPMREVKDDAGNFKYEQPLFWASYPQLRQLLARKEVFNTQNEAQRLTWEDVFEMRMFSSYITKESNVHDRRIVDYKQGNDALLEANNIKNTVFNFEHDLWSY